MSFVSNLICGSIKDPIEKSVCQRAMKDPCPFIFSNKNVVGQCRQAQRDLEDGTFINKVEQTVERIEASFRNITILCAIILVVVVVVVLLVLALLQKMKK